MPRASLTAAQKVLIDYRLVRLDALQQELHAQIRSTSDEIKIAKLIQGQDMLNMVTTQLQTIVQNKHFAPALISTAHEPFKTVCLAAPFSPPKA